MKQYKHIRMRLHLLDWIMYAVITASLGVLVYVGINALQEERAIIAAVAFVAFLLAGYSFSMTPRSLELSQEKISIRLWIGKVEIMLADMRNNDHLCTRS